MNKIELIGRLTKDPEYKEGACSITKFTLAVDRDYKKEGEPTADFISITTFGKLAENIHKYVGKGRLVAVEGRISTGSYEKDGRKYYTTNIIGEKVEFLERLNPDKTDREAQIPAGFERIDNEDIPF